MSAGLHLRILFRKGVVEPETRPCARMKMKSSRGGCGFEAGLRVKL
jgi:hypothetical protein